MFEDLPIFGAAIAKLIAREVEEKTTITSGLRKDGAPIWVEANARMVWDEATDRPRFTVIVLRDVTARHFTRRRMPGETGWKRRWCCPGR